MYLLTKMMTFAKKSAYLTPFANPSTISRSPDAAAAAASVTDAHLTYLFPMIADDWMSVRRISVCLPVRWDKGSPLMIAERKQMMSRQRSRSLLWTFAWTHGQEGLLSSASMVFSLTARVKRESQSNQWNGYWHNCSRRERREEGNEKRERYVNSKRMSVWHSGSQNGI